MRNNPGRSIESSAEHSLLSQYYFSLYMLHQGTLADALVIQAIADSLNLTLHIIESNPGFASVTNISPVRATVINTGYLDEIHYVPTQFPSTNQPLKEHLNKIALTQNALLTHQYFTYNEQL